MMIRVLLLCIALVSAGCVPRSGVSEQVGRSRPPVFTTVLPGQSLTLRLENGESATVTAGQPYVSALNEACVQINDYPSVGAACLQNGEWVGLPNIFVSRPGEKGMMQ